LPCRTFLQLSLSPAAAKEAEAAELSGYVDAIVNAANEKLSHGAGVAEAIAKRAGPDMTRECKDYIKKNKSLAVSKAFASSSGKLKFKKITNLMLK